MAESITISSTIKQKAIDLGFSACGIAKADHLSEEEARLGDWLGKGYHAEMNYMANHRGKRVDPRELVPGAKSVIVVLLNYFPQKQQQEKDAPKIAKYAYGKDYHKVVKDKLNILHKYINENIQPLNGRAFCDSAPILEHAWAAKAGLGWIGKNTQLINKDLGSFIFIGELIIDMELEYDAPTPAHCGTCTRCIDACPTHAIEKSMVINANKCISYLTIEFRGEIPSGYKGKMNNYVFGCDICQDVCPWNKKNKVHEIPEFIPHPLLLDMKKKDWKNLTEETYNEIFSGTPVDRIGYSGLMQNIRFFLNNI